MSNLIQNLSCLFSQQANPELASRQKAYMRGLFPFLGLSKPVRSQIQKEVFSSFSLKKEQELLTIVQALWEKEQREFQYAALDLARRYKRLWTKQSWEVFEGLIRQKSWWDTVDLIAANLVGKLALADPELFSLLDQWIEDENLWIRRSALLAQLGWRDQTRADKLFAYCQKTMHEKDFFMRKAIGWALRQYSKTNPEAVREFLEEHQKRLSPLSFREGRRYLYRS